MVDVEALKQEGYYMVTGFLKIDTDKKNEDTSQPGTINIGDNVLKFFKDLNIDPTPEQLTEISKINENLNSRNMSLDQVLGNISSPERRDMAIAVSDGEKSPIDIFKHLANEYLDSPEEQTVGSIENLVKTPEENPDSHEGQTVSPDQVETAKDGEEQEEGTSDSPEKHTVGSIENPVNAQEEKPVILLTDAGPDKVEKAQDGQEQAEGTPDSPGEHTVGPDKVETAQEGQEEGQEGTPDSSEGKTVGSIENPEKTQEDTSDSPEGKTADSDQVETAKDGEKVMAKVENVPASSVLTSDAVLPADVVPATVLPATAVLPATSGGYNKQNEFKGKAKRYKTKRKTVKYNKRIKTVRKKIKSKSKRRISKNKRRISKSKRRITKRRITKSKRKISKSKRK